MAEGLSRRRVGTPRELNDEDEGGSRTLTPSTSSVALATANGNETVSKTDRAPMLTLMEETLLLGLKDQEGYLS
ncbi:hypothetical protein GGI18_001765, partial [Coemansia linderi]